MKFTPGKINSFTLFKLPSAYFCGVRVTSISEESAIVTVKHKWINQNPFRSMFWAVQGMAAELSTGILMMKVIAESQERVSMLVTHMHATFTKKATGKIKFMCNDGLLVKETIAKAIASKEGHTVTLTAEGINEEGIAVSKFEFEWSVKLKSKK